MGRSTRYRISGVPQLLHQRGHNRLPCFLDGGDYQLFARLLQESAEQFSCEILALLQLPEAYWAVITPRVDDGLQRTIQRTGRLYVRHVNAKYRREGTLWAGRYSACPVQPSDAYLSEVSCYLKDLPSRRGIAPQGAPWPWYSSELPTASEQADIPVIERALRSGQVFGSTEYRKEMAALCGQPVEVRRRGRPPKRVSSP